MRVLGLVASPRNLGNSELLVKEMLASLPEDTEKEMIRLAALDIKPCKACYACLPQDKGCVIHDQLEFLLDRIKQADAVIIASACYFLGSHTSIKTITDRLISVLANGAEFTNKKCVTATVYGIPSWEGYARESVNNFAHFLHLDVVGDMQVQAASPGEVVNEETLAVVRQLAAKLHDSSIEVPPSVADVLLCEGCGSSLLQFKSSGKVRCVMCNAEGKVQPTTGGYTISFEIPGHERFSLEGMNHHTFLLEQIKNSYIANRHELYKRRKPYEAYNWWVTTEEK